VQLKQETTNAKRSIREMEANLAESTALSAKSEREYITLRDSMKHMVDGWKADVERLKEEMSRKEQDWKKEAEQLGKKYEDLQKFIQAERSVFFYAFMTVSLKYP
jgi:predicted  nucleic acid-binding Zn-ribbon protein